MPESGQPTVDPSILESIANHPGLQDTTAPDGTVTPAEDPSGTNFITQFSSGQPAREEREQPEPPAQAPPARLLAGKYKSVEELERAAIEKDRVIREREADLRAARAVNLHLEEIGLTQRNQRETPRERPVPVTFDEQQRPMVDHAALMAMVDERARAIANEQVNATLQPLQSLSVANNRLKAEYPEIASQEAAFAQWLQAHPDFQERVQRDPEFYLEGAALKFLRESGAATTQHDQQTNQAAQAQVAQARSNASPAGGGPTASRRPTETDVARKRLEELHRLGAETGNWKPYKDAITERAVGKPFLNSLDTTWGR